MIFKYYWPAFFILLVSCQDSKPESPFILLEKNHTGLDFRNMLKEDENFNIFKYQYFYNGGGVSVADFNNDGLEDIFFTGNMVKNRLFLNKGNLKFEDITESSGVAINEGWCTGANAIDINNDGWMDLYVCRAGYPFPDLRKNLLLLNNKDNTFTDVASQYGIDDEAHSTHSAFLDYDKDGDLDLFLVNHSTPEYSKGNLDIYSLKNKRDPLNTNKLYRNDEGKYTDVSEASGIIENVLTFSLGASVADLNNDFYPDIYITNDFNEPDHLFINQKDGTFLNEAADKMSNMSMFSMGSDFSDINGDGQQDIVSLDMLPETNFLQKMHSGADNFDKVETLVDNGFLNQSMRNSLHLSTGDGNYIEAGQFSGISNTDWSWAPLFFDFDNDGVKDLFISNGYMRDHTDMDFLQYTADLVIKIDQGDSDYSFEEYLASMPSIELPNYFYKNNELNFSNKSPEWGLTKNSVSQGAAYSDLDNDGDQDLVVNNSGDYAFIYQNNENLNSNNWVKFNLKGGTKNIDGIGAKIILYYNGKSIMQEFQPSRGFQSSSSYNIHFGTAETSRYDSVKVIWNDMTEDVLKDVSCCTLIDITKSSNSGLVQEEEVPSSYFNALDLGIDYTHSATEFKDFNIQPLMPFYLTDFSPILAKCDINGDKRDDVIIGGSVENKTLALLQSNRGTFEKRLLDLDGMEISDIDIADINGDGVEDAVFANGSYRYKMDDGLASIEILYGSRSGNYKIKTIKPAACNPSCSVIGDLNMDGKADLFIGGKDWYNNYPLASASQLILDIENNDKAVINLNIGNVQDAEVIDIDNDGINELIIVGHWNHIKIFNFSNNVLVDNSSKYFANLHNGYWTGLSLLDLNNDGKKDLLAYNLGTNNQLFASHTHPIELYFKDIDDNGSIDPFIGYYIIDNTYSFVSREDAIKQVPSLAKKYLSFNSYANESFKDMMDPYPFLDSQRKKIDTLGTMIFLNVNGKFVEHGSPKEIDMAPVYSSSLSDVDGDGDQDLITFGNKEKNKVKLGNLNGNRTQLFLNDGNGNLNYTTNGYSGMSVKGDIRSAIDINVDGKMTLITCPIGGTLHAFQLK